MRIVDWSETKAEADHTDYFEGLNEDVSQEILVAILSMNEQQKNNRWKASIVRKPKLGFIYIELRKNLADGECQGLIVVGRSDDNKKYPHHTKFRAGHAKLSLNGTAYLTQFEIKEMSLAVAEAEIVWDNFVKTDPVKSNLIER